MAGEISNLRKEQNRDLTDLKRDYNKKREAIVERNERNLNRLKNDFRNEEKKII